MERDRLGGHQCAVRAGVGEMPNWVLRGGLRWSCLLLPLMLYNPLAQAQALVNQIVPGSRITPKEEVRLYGTPPASGALYRLPEQVRTARRGEELRVLDEWLVVRNPKGADEKWVRIAGPRELWAYVGE